MLRKTTKLAGFLPVLGLMMTAAIIPAEANKLRETMNKKVAAASTCNNRQRTCLRTGTYEWRTQADSVGLERR